MKTQLMSAVRGAWLVALFSGSATAGADNLPAVPDSLKVPTSQVLSVEARAIGVQIYDCNQRKDDPAQFEYILRAPEADLFDAAGGRIGKHYAGPSWEANDGSKVVGEATARDAGPDSNAIPWLLLAAKSASTSGLLARTVNVQRVNTVGGKAPATGCSVAQAGKELRVPYTATYLFNVSSEAPRSGL